MCVRVSAVPIIISSFPQTQLKSVVSREQEQPVPMFGVCEEMRKDKRKEAARAILLEQLALVAEKKKREKRETLRMKQDEQEMIKRTKEK